MIIDFSKYSSCRAGEICEVKILNEICDFEGQVLGEGNNILICNKNANLAILGDNFDFIKFDGETLEIGAKTKARKIYNFAKNNDLKGFEILANIPGNLGGLLTMNAGLKGFSISDNLISIQSSKGEFSKDDCKFEYRNSLIPGVIFGAKFKALKGFDENLNNEFKLARKNQPKGASFGSCFKNPKGDFAGRLIEEVGLKGKNLGKCEFSQKHANFLINLGKASSKDMLNAINLAKNLVFEKFKIKLEEEVKII